MKVIIINGAAGSGKDTFANMCIDNNNGAGAIISMADAAKDVAKFCGWDGEKTPKNRKFLSNLNLAGHIPSIVGSFFTTSSMKFSSFSNEGEISSIANICLSNIKDIIDEWGDMSFKFVENFINSLYNCGVEKDNWIIFIMSREPNDIKRLKERFNAHTIYISNHKAEQVRATNHADAEVKCFIYDEYIDNNGTLEELNLESKNFIERIMKNGICY